MRCPSAMAKNIGEVKGKNQEGEKEKLTVNAVALRKDIFKKRTSYLV